MQLASEDSPTEMNAKAVAANQNADSEAINEEDGAASFHSCSSSRLKAATKIPIVRMHQAIVESV